jgi:2-dehydro-3-deoxyphosphogalactonate aldolase
VAVVGCCAESSRRHPGVGARAASSDETKGPMKIVEGRAYVVGVPPPHYGGTNWLFVKLTTDEGIHGWGEAFGSEVYWGASAKLIDEMCEHFVVGADPFQIERLWKTLYASGYNQHPDILKLSAQSAIEIACWDIVGKALGQPIHNLLGGRYHDKIRTYTYLYPAPADSLPANAAMHYNAERCRLSAEWSLELGHTAIKFDPLRTRSTWGPSMLSRDELDNAEAVVRGVREVVFSKAEILIVTHGQMTPAAAIMLAKRLEPYEPLWLEEPIPPENVDEMARVARATTIPIATGERLATRYEYRLLLEKQACSTLQMALGRVGGILEAKKIAAMAEAHYVNFAPHLWAGPIESAASLQLDACCPNFLIQEGIGEWGGFYDQILKEPFAWDHGYVSVPTGPGLGVDLDEEVMRKHPYNPVRGRDVSI